MKSWCLALSLGVLLLLLDPSFEAVVSGKTMFLGWALWQYGLWSFQTGYIKYVRLIFFVKMKLVSCVVYINTTTLIWLMILCCFCLCNFFCTIPGMKFSLLNKQSRDSSPSISVTFPDGYSDELVLWNYYSNNKDRIDPGNENNCNYFGHLANEKSACAAMTGCIGSEDVLFTIMSDHAPGSFNFIWTKEGKVDIVDPDEFVSI